MKHLHKIAFLPLCAALLLAACDRNRHTPDPDTQKAPISFAALSQNIPVKAGEIPLSSIHDNFGIWGYATKQEHPDYLIWEDETMSRVRYNGSSFFPDTYAFWLSGYDYNFIAIAPYTDGTDRLRLTGFTIGPNKDALTFAYDMSDIYAPSAENVVPRPGIDLMGSIAKRPAYKVGEDGVQNLIFHRLTSRIDIKVKFLDDDGDNMFESTSISGMRLRNVDADASYTISYSEASLGIRCTIGENSESDIPLTLTQSSDGWWTVTAYIFPQSVTGFRLYMDFTIDGVEYKDFPITLNFPADDTDYAINQWHTWNITLKPSLFVLFEPSVTDWADGGQADDEIGFN